MGGSVGRAHHCEARERLEARTAAPASAQSTTNSSAGWVRAALSGPSCGVRNGHKVVALGGLLFLLGGWDGTTYFNDLWGLDLASAVLALGGGAAAPPGWVQLLPSGATGMVPPRSSFSWDAVGGQTFVFGGSECSREAGRVVLLSLLPSAPPPCRAQPTSHTPPGSPRRAPSLQTCGPLRRWRHRRHVLLLPALTPAPPLIPALPAAAPQLEPFPDGLPVGWAPVLPSGGPGAPWPPCRYGHSSGVSGGTLYIFGGMTFPGCGAGGGPTPAPLADLWAFDSLAGTWAEITQGQPAPGPLGVPAGVVVGAAYYVYGGADQDSGFPELWRWTPPPAAPLPPPPQCADGGGSPPVTVVALAV